MPPQALEEAARQLSKSRAPDRDARLQDASARAADMRRFLDARASLASDPAAAVASCQQLLAAEPAAGAEAAAGATPRRGARVRAGDVLAMLVEWCVSQGNAPQALQLLQQMAARGLAPEKFLEPGLVAGVYEEMGALPPQLAAAAAPPPQQQQAQQEEQGGEEAAGWRAGAEGGEVQEEDLPYIGDEVDGTDSD